MSQCEHDSDSWGDLQGLVQIIYGEPASKANSRRVVRLGGVSRLIKSQKALDYSELFAQQCKPLKVLLTCDLKVTMWIWYASRRPDLDESLILDLMQGRLYINDRQVKEKHIYWGLDKEKPRAEILLEPMPEQKKPRSRRGLKTTVEVVREETNNCN